MKRWISQKLWRVAAFEYGRNVFQRRFLLVLLSLPAILLAMVVVAGLIFWMEQDSTPIGFVDHSGLLTLPADSLSGSPPLRHYDAEIKAQDALEAGAIQAYYVLTESYLKSGRTHLIYLDHPPGSMAEGLFARYVRANLLQNVDPEMQDRLLADPQFLLLAPDGSTQPMGGEAMLRFILPLILGFGFITAIFTSAGYLMEAVVDEKENRTMEVLLTSLSDQQLIAGKILGITGIGLTQILVWGGMVMGGIYLGRPFLPLLGQLQMPPEYWLSIGLIMLPAYILIAAVMVAIGSTVTQASEGQQMTGFLLFPTFITYWFVQAFIEAPHSPLSVGLSLFPLTAPVAMPIRAGVAAVPLWQMALCVGLLVLSALGALGLATRAFRLGSLRYGARLNWRELIGCV